MFVLTCAPLKPLGIIVQFLYSSDQKKQNHFFTAHVVRILNRRSLIFVMEIN